MNLIKQEGNLNNNFIYFCMTDYENTIWDVKSEKRHLSSDCGNKKYSYKLQRKVLELFDFAVLEN
jgi:hypothetical protein